MDGKKMERRGEEGNDRLKNLEKLGIRRKEREEWAGTTEVREEI